MPDDVIKLIETQKLTAGHAKILVGLDNASFVACIKLLKKNFLLDKQKILLKYFKNKKIKSSAIKRLQTLLHLNYLYQIKLV